MRKRLATAFYSKRKVVIVNGCRYCGGAVHSRGLCRSHYQQAWRYVAEEQTTWKELESTGRVAEPQSEFKDWLLKK